MQFQNVGGVVAWATNWPLVDFTIYDPARGGWQTNAPVYLSGSAALVTIDNATVHYTTASGNYTEGYNSPSHKWYAGPTIPLARISWSPVAGKAPLTVFFWDLSVGDGYWNFQDGSSGPGQELVHTFPGPGRYNVGHSMTVASDVSNAETTVTVGFSTSTVLGTSAASVAFGRPLTLTARVATDPSSRTTPSGGTVTFLDGGAILGTAPLSAGAARLTISSLAAGKHALRAIYSGDGVRFAGSSTTGKITTVAGKGTAGYGGDGGPATAARLNVPFDVAVDAAGNIFIADSFNSRVREVNHATGKIATVAGNGTAGYSGDGGPATAAELSDPDGLALDAAGDIFIADAGNNCIREVDYATGKIATVAGNGTAGYTGDFGLAAAAELNDPGGLALDTAGDLFVADFGNNAVRKVDLAAKTISTAAGNGTAGFSGDGGSPTAAELNGPASVALDGAGDLFIADQENKRIREVGHAAGKIATVAGDGNDGLNGDGGPATAAGLYSPAGVAADAAGNLFIADTFNRVIREVDHATGVITTVAGNGSLKYSGDGGSAVAAGLVCPFAVAVDAAGDLFVADTSGNRIRRVASGATVLTVIGVPTTTTVTSDHPQGAAYGQAITFTAVVHGSKPGTPTGTVTFKDHGVALPGNSTVQLSGGAATFLISTLSAGAHSITATYNGDDTFGASTSGKLKQTVVSGASKAPLVAAVPSALPAAVADFGDSKLNAALSSAGSSAQGSATDAALLSLPSSPADRVSVRLATVDQLPGR
jgi:sugar lactone lactonase YvrE